MRMQQASKILDDLDKTIDFTGVGTGVQEAANPLNVIASYIPGVANNIQYGSMLPDWMKGEEVLMKDQAQRNFVNAILRRESGAVISASEFDNAARQYFTQWGDTDETISQKAANRRLAAAAVMAGAGNFDNDVKKEEIQSILERDVANMGGMYVGMYNKAIIPVAEGKYKAVDATQFILSGIKNGLYRPDKYLEERLQATPPAAIKERKPAKPEPKAP